MAIIKCRCTIPYCEYCQRHERLIHSKYWWCDDGHCDIDCYTRPSDAPSNTINPQCIYCEYRYEEFEIRASSYRYEDGDLMLGKKIYHDFDIGYLEIDGRVLVDRGA